MNAEALIGTILGTCTLQRLIGQGGMGAVFLAQQSRPRRQVAVKVLFPMSPLTPHQHAAFLERFRRETDAAASLEHPNITPVHEYGEQDGLAYLVMPYISGGTLRDEMERRGPLPLEKVLTYLEQMGAALDHAHERGVIHRDIKPANILLTAEGRLLLTDFGLVKIVAGRVPQVRLTGEGAPVGTPDYMAPEQVIGEDVDARADLYSLGVILYQMVTGTTPFQGETPMQIAAQHLQIPAPSPQMLRPDLSVLAEQVILRSLAKRPSDRYQTAQELARAFRVALMQSGYQLSPQSTGAMSSIHMSNTGQMRATNTFPTASRQTGAMPAAGGGLLMNPTGTMPSMNPGGLLSRTGAMPAANAGAGNFLGQTGAMPAAGGGLLSRAGTMPPTNAGGGLLSRTGAMPTTQGGASMIGQPPSVQAPVDTGSMPITNTANSPVVRAGGGLLSRTGMFPRVGTGLTGAIPAVTPATPPSPGSIPFTDADLNAMGTPSSTYESQSSVHTTGYQSAAPFRTITGSLSSSGQQQGGTVKLTGPVKVVKVPVAGQPGQYVTGLLPVSPQIEIAAPPKKHSNPWMKIVAVVVALLLLGGGGFGAYWYMGMGQQPQGQQEQQPTAQQTLPTQVQGTPDVNATATAKATADIILSDSLNENIHNWPVEPGVYAFKDGAYHITNNGKAAAASVLQTDYKKFEGPMGYSLTMKQVKGENSGDNNFGMIFRLKIEQKDGKTVTTFYTFEIVNTKGGEYKFYKYDDSKVKGKNDQNAAWTEIWRQNFGAEFKSGNNDFNTLKVFMDGSKFTFIVNGKTIKTIEDKSFAEGTVGMLVNKVGTEVAFKNLLLTKK